MEENVERVLSPELEGFLEKMIYAGKQMLCLYYSSLIIMYNNVHKINQEVSPRIHASTYYWRVNF